MYLLSKQKKEGHLTQSFYKSPYTNRKFQKVELQHKTPPKTSITPRLRTDLGRTIGETTAIQKGVVKPVYRIPTFPLTAKAV